MTVRKDGNDLSYATLDIAKSDLKGDSKWFLNRKEKLMEQ
jgi:hypothetical protein